LGAPWLLVDSRALQREETKLSFRLKYSGRTADSVGMQVNPNLSTGPVGRAAEKPLTKARPAANTDATSFQNSQSVNSALQQATEVRSEVVARAQALIQDPDYPPTATIDAIGKLVAAVYNTSGGDSDKS
jgi:hypothetical protein